MQLSLNDLRTQAYEQLVRCLAKILVFLPKLQSLATLELKQQTNSNQMDVMGTETKTISLVKYSLKEKICWRTLKILFISSPYILMMRLKWHRLWKCVQKDME